jgi:hypothetical protein
MKISIFWDITQCCQVKVNGCSGGNACGLFHTGSLLVLLFDPNLEEI